MNLKFWYVYRKEKDKWIFINRFYFSIRADECIDSHRIIDQNYKMLDVEYKKVQE